MSEADFRALGDFRLSAQPRVSADRDVQFRSASRVNAEESVSIILRNQKRILPTVMTSKPKVVFVLGPPGSGKGTQCEKIVAVSANISAVNYNGHAFFLGTYRPYGIIIVC